MSAAAHVITITREPLIEAVGQTAYKWYAEDPRYEAALRQHVQQLFDRRRALPGFSARADHLQGIRVRPGRYPWKTRHDSRRLRGHDLELAPSIPFAKNVRQSRADL